MKPVLLHRAAERELKEAVAFYEAQTKGLGLRFANEVGRMIVEIGLAPEHFAQYKQTPIRRCVIDRFPYLIFFREMPLYIWVVAVAHSRRRPDYWRSRR